MKILIIRHAEPDYANHTLTEKGFREAEFLGRYLQDTKIDKMYVSSLERAIYTADGILKYQPNIPHEYCDWLQEVDVRVDLPYKENALTWDFLPSYINANDGFFNIDKWTYTAELNDERLRSRVKEIRENLFEVLAKHGYVRNGRIFDVEKANTGTIAFVCHFGLESYLLSNFFEVPAVVTANFTCARTSSITTLVSEEREKGKAIFRMLGFGEIPHLQKFNEEPSFMARFPEVFEDNK